MPSDQAIEAKIRDVLRMETSAIVLSNKLFTPGGLFAALASTETERRQLVRSPLFQEAQARLSLLQRKEAKALSHAAAAIDRQLEAKTRMELT